MALAPPADDACDDRLELSTSLRCRSSGFSTGFPFLPLVATLAAPPRFAATRRDGRRRLRGLSSLIDKSLVRPSSKGIEPRYQLCESFREYAPRKALDTRRGATVDSSASASGASTRREPRIRLRSEPDDLWRALVPRRARQLARGTAMGAPSQAVRWRSDNGLPQPFGWFGSISRRWKVDDGFRLLASSSTPRLQSTILAALELRGSRLRRGRFAIISASVL